MSAIVAVWCTDGRPTASETGEAVMAALSHRGVDGSDTNTLGDGAVFLGHQHFWTTPEEVGEQQPLVEGALALAYGGRLDNRAEILDTLGLDIPELRTVSDARIVLAAYRRWGADLPRHLLGPFALALYDHDTQRMLLARDRLGTRVLAYARVGHDLVAASEPAAVTAGEGVTPHMDQDALACLLSMLQVDASRSLFRDVRLVEPGHVTEVTCGGISHRRYWSPDETPIRCGSDSEYAERYRSVLTRCVTRRTRASGSVGVQMSGGLDSTSVAAVVSRTRVADARPLETFSYVFDRFALCDERAYIDETAARLGLEAHTFAGDELWPLRDAADWPFDANAPLGPFVRLLALPRQRAVEAGYRVLLTGYGGDEAYGGQEDWLAALILEGRLRHAAAETLKHVRHNGFAATARSNTMRRVVSTLIPIARGRRARSSGKPDWLTDDGWRMAQSAAAATDLGVLGTRCWPGATRSASLVGLSGAFNRSVPAIQLRNPLRDVDYLTFMANIPAHQLYDRGHVKHVQRNAMRGILPDAITDRASPTSLELFFRYGIRRELDTVVEILASKKAPWIEWLLVDAVTNDLPSGRIPRHPLDVVLWYSAASELWRRGLMHAHK